MSAPRWARASAEFRKAATDVKDATSLEEKLQSAPAPAAVAPAAAPAVPVPAVNVAEAAPDISEMPDPQPVADEQPTPTA